MATEVSSTTSFNSRHEKINWNYDNSNEFSGSKSEDDHIFAGKIQTKIQNRNYKKTRKITQKMKNHGHYYIVDIHPAIKGNLIELSSF